ncbi:MAG TPA: hypothetical protein VFX49_13370 [Chloroflexota bacterium]|nr:hypothetical protein [Chloroflexota bacterium]
MSSAGANDRIDAPRPHRARRVGAAALCFTSAALFLAQLAAPAGAQGVPSVTPTPTRTPGPAVTVTFRCPGVTAVSIGADLLGSGTTSTTSSSASTTGSSVTPTPTATPTPSPELSPAEAAESPCLLADAGPELEWTYEHSALRMTTVGTWKQKLRTVLSDFDVLHAQYVADPIAKDMGIWTARMQETLELARLVAYQSKSDQVYYYAVALENEYKSGIYDERPLLISYALQARQRLDELTGSPTPTPTRRAR